MPAVETRSTSTSSRFTPIDAAHALRADTRRITAIDAARGAAMLFVCLAHMGYLPHAGFAAVASAVGYVGMVATPSFVLISGMSIGALAALQASIFPSLERKLRDRAAFLLLVGHPLLAATVAIRGATWHSGLAGLYITDAIAFALLIGPRLAVRTSAELRLALAVLTYAVAVVLDLSWTPPGFLARLAKVYLVGSFHPDAHAFKMTVFAVLPWLSVYLAGTGLGTIVGRNLAASRPDRAVRLTGTAGAICLGGGAVVKLAVLALKWSGHGVAALAQSYYWVVSPLGKYPPSPLYLALFGGAAMLMLSGVLAVSQTAVGAGVIDRLATIGRASLVVYILQAFLFATLPRFVPASLMLWPPVYGASVALLWFAARAWNRHIGNQWLGVRALTLALPRLFLRPRMQRA